LSILTARGGGLTGDLEKFEKFVASGDPVLIIKS
jgi:hypothetical protein